MMHKRWTLSLRALALGACCGGFLGGCASLSGYPKNPDDEATLSSLRDKFFGAGFDSDYTGVCGDSRQPVRDKIVFGQIKVYDLELSLLKRALNGEGNKLSVGSGLVSAALDAAGAVTGSAETKSALAAASGGVLAAEGVINKDLYYQKTLPSVIAQMEANLAKAEGTIFVGLKQTDCAYPLYRAEIDVDKLADAGSLPSAISVMTQQSSDSKDTAQTSNALIQTGSYATDPDATKLRTWLYHDGTIDQARKTALVNWMKNSSIPGLQDYPYAALLTLDDPTLAEARKQALADTTLNIGGGN